MLSNPSRINIFNSERNGFAHSCLNFTETTSTEDGSTERGSKRAANCTIKKTVLKRRDGTEQKHGRIPFSALYKGLS